MTAKKIKVAVVGATGYVGMELIRLLSRHPTAQIIAATSDTHTGKAISELFPWCDLELAFIAHDQLSPQHCDLVFFATPHTYAMEKVEQVLQAGVKVIDLSADFRLKDTDLWQQWYEVEHKASKLLSEAVYGLPELNRKAIQSARLIANPGCYPTAIILGLYPLLKQGIAIDRIIADAKSGISGAGRRTTTDLNYVERTDSFKAYHVSGHRHYPEIIQCLQSIATNFNAPVSFVPHLVPMKRGIFATLYVTVETLEDWQSIYSQYYQSEPFVHVLPKDSQPETCSVRGTNHCQIALYAHPDKKLLIILSVIDNLVKGATGQAIQNMNICFGLDECLGLDLSPFIL